MSYGRNLNRKSKIIAVNRNRDQLLKNSDMFWKPTLAVQSDVADFILRLADSAEASKYNSPNDWVKELRDRDDEKDVQIK